MLKMNILAVIPARGGSKGIPRKNLVPVAGKPLISYSIAHALRSKLITRTIVSTEDLEIAEVSKKFGAEVPFLRPASLAEDHVLDIPVFQHVLNDLKKNEDYIPEIVVHLRPTAPFRKEGWIDNAVTALIENSKADSLRSVSEVVQHPYRMFNISSDQFLNPIMKREHPEPYLLRRQDLPKIYYYNCVIDITRPNTIFNKNSMTGDKIIPFIMNPDDVFDIDTPRDLEWANFFLKGRL